MRIHLAVLVLGLCACGGDDGDDEPASLEHVGIASGMLRDPATARATHDTDAIAAEPGARAGGDVAHIVGLGGEILGTPRDLWTVIDRWERPDALDGFYGDPALQAGLARLVDAPSITTYRREPTWHTWGDYDAGAGRPRWYVLVRGTLRDPETAQAVHDEITSGGEAGATALGDAAHLAFTGRTDAREYLGIDIWTAPGPIEAFYTDPRIAAALGELFEGAPTVTVLHATDWHQWGSSGKPTLDGEWLITRYTCGGTEVPLGDFRLDVRGGGGTFVQRFDAGCVARYDETYAYPAAAEFTITPDAIACDPSSSCEAILGASCLPLPPSTAFGWSLAGDTLTFTRTAMGPGDLPCEVGAAIEFTMQRQAL